MQEPLAGIDVPAIARLAPPLAAVIVPPVHVVAALVVAAFTRPAGYVSVNATPVMADVFALVSVTVSVEVAPVVIGLAEKALATDGWLRTFNVPVAAAALPAFVVEMAPVLDTTRLGVPALCVYVTVPLLPLDANWSLNVDDDPVATLFDSGRFCEITLAVAENLKDASMTGFFVPQLVAALVSLLGYGVRLTSQRYTVYEAPLVTVAGTVNVPFSTGGMRVEPV